jgi:hypothetical protein
MQESYLYIKTAIEHRQLAICCGFQGQDTNSRWAGITGATDNSQNEENLKNNYYCFARG